MIDQIHSNQTTDLIHLNQITDLILGLQVEDQEEQSLKNKLGL